MLAAPEAERARLLDIKTPFVTIPNGLDVKEFEELPDPEIFYKKFPHTRYKTLIIFLGRIDPKKGLDLLAKSFARVHQQFPEVHLIIAGPDNIGFLPTAQGYFAEAGCLEAVTFTGMLSGQLKYAALDAASVYVAPSYSEGFSMSVLEGMAVGLPCIITTGCNFPEAGTAQAACVVAIDFQELAHAMIKYLTYPQEAREMGDRARQLIFKNYTWEKIAKRTIQVYHAIIQQKSLLEFQQYM
jgi:glycosyltransferase involved in cell wall biosynthesis